MTIITQTFHNYNDARVAVLELKACGIDPEDISLIANDPEQVSALEENTIADAAGTGAGVGAALGGAGGLLAGLGLVTVPGVGPVVAAGWLAATLAGLASGAAVGAATGTLLSALGNEGLSESDAKFYAEFVASGGSLICVRTDDADADEVQTILARQRSLEVGSPLGSPRISRGPRAM